MPVSQQTEGVVPAGLTVFNAVIGLRQEAKAEESVKAPAQLLKTVARVRRDGRICVAAATRAATRLAPAGT